MNLLDSVQGNSLFSVTFFLFSCPQRSSYVSDKEKKLNHKAIKKKSNYLQYVCISYVCCCSIFHDFTV